MIALLFVFGQVWTFLYRVFCYSYYIIRHLVPVHSLPVPLQGQLQRYEATIERLSASAAASSAQAAANCQVPPTATRGTPFGSSDGAGMQVGRARDRCSFMYEHLSLTVAAETKTAFNTCTLLA